MDLDALLFWGHFGSSVTCFVDYGNLKGCELPGVDDQELLLPALLFFSKRILVPQVSDGSQLSRDYWENGHGCKGALADSIFRSKMEACLLYLMWQRRRPTFNVRDVHWTLSGHVHT